MTDALLHAAKILAAVAGITVSLTAIWAFWRRVLPAWRAGKRTAGALQDTLLGSPAIVDPGTGMVLREERLGLGVRLHAVEQGQKDVASALSNIADLIHDQKAQDSRIDGLDRRVAALENASIERTVTRAESAAMWTAIAAERTADVEPDAEPPAPVEPPED